MAATLETQEDLLYRLKEPFFSLDDEEKVERLKWDTPAFAAFTLIIEDDSGAEVRFVPKPEQLRFDAALEAQRRRGEPMRAIVLKARKLGFSSWTQAKIIQRVTQKPNHRALVLGQDTTTGGALFDIGRKMWDLLPEDIPAFKPKLKYKRRLRSLELDNGSIYRADGAKEFEAGRGLTLHSLHLSEVAFYDDAERKLQGLINAVPKTHPDTMIILESTARGQNYFKDLWDSAEAGESDYIPFFSPWFHEPFYRRAFPNDAELEDFRELIGEGTVGEDENDLIDLMLAESMPEDEILERLYWRRWVIRGVEFNGDIDRFHVEYPSTPIEAFMTSGRNVFDVASVRRMQTRVRELPEPRTGRLEPKGPLKARMSRGVTVHFPTAVEFVEGPVNDDRRPGWRVWQMPQPYVAAHVDEHGTEQAEVPKGQYVIGGDASGGDEIEGTGAYHVLSVCDHRTRLQVAEYRSRIDPDELALEAYKACLFFNMPWIGIEVTGSWGGPAMRRLAIDYRYPFCYKRQKLASVKDQKFEDRLGWHTGFESKKLLISELKEMLRTGEDGTMSRGLADEYGWYITDERNRQKPEHGKTADRLLARGIAVCIAREKPLRPDRKPGQVSSTIDQSLLSRKTSYF